MSPPAYYEHSGNFSPVLLVLGALVASAVSLPLAWLYAYAIYYIPFIYINVVLTVGLAFAVGMIVVHVMRGAKVRNGVVFGAAALLVTAVAFYGHWAAWLGIFSRESGLDIMASDVAQQPGAMWAAILEINATGAWSLFGIEFSGTPLWGIWALEGAIIVGGGFLIAFGAFVDVPFCERCGSWCKKHPNVARVWHADPAAVVKAFESRDFETLQSFETVPHSKEVGRWFECDVETCSTCGETNTLDVSLVQAGKDNDGDVSKDETEILSNLLLTKEEVAAIRSLGGVTVAARLEEERRFRGAQSDAPATR